MLVLDRGVERSGNVRRPGYLTAMGSFTTLTKNSTAARGATVLPHLEFGYPSVAAGAISPRRFVIPGSTGTLTQASAGATNSVGVCAGDKTLAAGDQVPVGIGPQVVDADDVLVPGQEIKVGNGGRALAFLNTALSGTTIEATGAGLAFTNQPANDGVEVVSSSAADTTQTATIIGTTNGANTVVVETVTLNGTTFVPTVKTDWGLILAVKLSASCAGTITFREASADAAITTITTGNTSKGVETVTSADQQAFNVAPTGVCSGSGTKQIGLQGTNSAGTVIYDSKALNGTTAVTFNSGFKRITEVYTGDLESGRTATIKTGAVEDRQLVVGRVLIGAAAADAIAYCNIRG